MPEHVSACAERESWARSVADAPAAARVGVLRQRLPDGELWVALGCAACHVARREGVLVPGMADDARHLGDLPAGALADQLRAWGAGRVDVTADNGAEPRRGRARPRRPP